MLSVGTLDQFCDIAQETPRKRNPAADGKPRRGDLGTEGDIQLIAARGGHQDQETQKGRKGMRQAEAP